MSKRHHPLLRVELQRAKGDCCIASLATITQRTYEDVLAEAARECPLHPHNDGMHFSEVLRIAEQLGCSLRRKSKVNFARDKGILDVKVSGYGGTSRYHALVLMEGLIFDLADGTVWKPDVFQKRYKADFGNILVPNE
jgi:hypothetical protein